MGICEKRRSGRLCTDLVAGSNFLVERHALPYRGEFESVSVLILVQPLLLIANLGHIKEVRKFSTQHAPRRRK